MVTNAGELSCGYVIHAVGPIYDENDPETANQKMIQVIESILQLMIDYDFKSVSIPGISTGIYRFPLKDAAKLMCETTKSFIGKHKSEMKKRQIVFCNFDDKTTDAFTKYVSKIFPANKELNSEPEESAPEPPRCSNCNHKIKDTSHQKKGKHLDICLKCYEKLKIDCKKKNKYEDGESDKQDPDDEKRKSKKIEDSENCQGKDSEEVKDKKHKTSKKKNRHNKKEKSENDEAEGEGERNEESMKKSKINEDNSERNTNKSKKKDSDENENENENERQENLKLFLLVIVKIAMKIKKQKVNLKTKTRKRKRINMILINFKKLIKICKQILFIFINFYV